MQLCEIANSLGFPLGGDGELSIRHLRYARDAEPDDLAVARTLVEARRTRAKAVLVKDGIIPDKTLLYCPLNPKKGGIFAAMALIAHFLVQSREAPDYDSMPNYKELPSHPGVMAGESVIIGQGTSIGPFTLLGNNVTIGKHVNIAGGVLIGSGSIIGDNVVIESGARIASAAFFHYRLDNKECVFNGIGGVSIGSNVTIASNTVIQRGTLSDTKIGCGTAIGSLVVIGHDVNIGENCLIVSQAGISGQVSIGNGASIYGQAGVVERVNIGHDAIIMGQSRIIKDVPDGETISGDYNRSHRAELRLQALIERLATDKDGPSRKIRSCKQ